MRTVSKNSPIPLYYQIKEIIQEMIENDEIKPGNAIPPERELCDIQGVSRMTVNKAIMELVNEGVLYREQGKGTFVSSPKEYQKLSQLKGFSEVMKSKGYSTTAKILSFNTKIATKQIKDILQLPDGKDEVINIKRLRFVEREPIAIETVWIPKHMFPSLSIEMIEGKSLYDIFKKIYDYDLEAAKETIEPKILDTYEFENLDQPKSTLALLFKKVLYIKDKTPIEYTEAVYRSDKYKYEIFTE